MRALLAAFIFGECIHDRTTSALHLHARCSEIDQQDSVEFHKTNIMQREERAEPLHYLCMIHKDTGHQ